MCWCGSAVEHHLGKVVVTGPIPVTSSIKKSNPCGWFFLPLDYGSELPKASSHGGAHEQKCNLLSKYNFDKTSSAEN